MIRIAVSKGRVAKQALEQLKAFGYTFSTFPERQLWAVDDLNQLELIFLKAQDVPLYVEKGVADLGIVGEDVLRENPLALYSLLNLNIGRCQMCLAGSADVIPDDIPYLRLASKYPNIAKAYLEDQAQAGAVMTLQGSVELAPLLGISDLIVDLVESGQTLDAHDLVVHKVLFEVSATLIANQKLYALKKETLEPFVNNWSDYIFKKEQAYETL
jgi:ATP phosphoribosyltransferase